MGSYNHLSDSLHVYERDVEQLEAFDMQVEAIANIDSLRLPKEESDGVFASLEKHLETMAGARLTEGRMRELMEGNGLPEAFGNLLRIVATDSARRRGWVGLAEAAAAGCTNGALVQAWDRWRSRVDAQ